MDRRGAQARAGCGGHAADGQIRGVLLLRRLGDSIDLLDALHPRTLLAYGMNGRDLPTQHGAPVRLRVERKMGYKSMKFVKRIAVIDEFDDGARRGTSRTGGRTRGSEGRRRGV